MSNEWDTNTLHKAGKYYFKQLFNIFFKFIEIFIWFIYINNKY